MKDQALPKDMLEQRQYRHLRQSLLKSDTAKKSLGEEEAQVFEAHLMILNDPEFTGAIENEIKSQKINAEAAGATAIPSLAAIPFKVLVIIQLNLLFS